MSAQTSQEGKCNREEALLQPSAPATMRLAVSVLRVSTKKQLNEGDGIENQRRGNAEYIRRKGYRLGGEFVIAETADNKERADFASVLDQIIARKKEIDVVVFWKVDRISRGGVGNYYALKAFLAKHGIRIEFATEQIDASPVGELMESILAATARFENRLRVDRTIGVEKILTNEGYWCRAAPTGFANGRAENGKPILVPHPDPRQWELLQYGLRKQLSGAYKLTEVAAELRKQGFVSRKGLPISRQDWERICRNPLYGGLICEKWTEHKVVRAKFDGALTPEEWQGLQAVLDERGSVAKRLPRKRLHPDFPLRRFLRCPQCRGTVRGYAAKGKTGRRFPYYDCENAACRFRVPVPQAHALFVKLLEDVTPSPDLLDGFRRVVLSVWDEEYRECNARSNDLQARVLRLREEKRRLVEVIKASAGNPSLLEELQKDFDRVTKELTLGTVERNTAELKEYEAEAVVNHCIWFMQNASELWQKWPVDLQNRLQVMVFPEGVGYEVLEGKANPKLSLVHAAIAKNDGMAAPVCRTANPGIQALIDWYNLLRPLPFGPNLAMG
ncbi:MAG: recombinase family protein [Gemmataceae bacterium]|nr:recombinase family protein [Gemmataceae bacterium]